MIGPKRYYASAPDQRAELADAIERSVDIQMNATPREERVGDVDFELAATYQDADQDLLNLVARRYCVPGAWSTAMIARTAGRIRIVLRR